MSSTTDQPTKNLTVLEQIIVRKRAELVADRALVKEADLERRKRPSRRGFRKALEKKAPAIISEIKKASPSAGVIAENFQPAELARNYERAGAACVSVLTDKQFFQGSLDDLTEARASCGLPVLRKDFTLDRYHLLQASAAGADCVLLIVAALTDQEIADLLAQAKEFELDVLVEVHNEAELERALGFDVNLIGVNNRNLKTLEVDLETSLRLAPLIPDHVLRVSESGIRTADDIKRLTDVGYSAFLIGESLMKQADPGGALAKLLGELNVPEIIKVCGIVEPADALAAVQAGATAIGMVFYPASPRFVRLDQAAMVSAIISLRALKVGVFVNETPERIRAVADAVRLDVIQLHGDEPPSDIAALDGLRVWKALPVGDSFEPARMDDYDCEAILLDTAKADAYGGSGQTFPWHKALEAKGKRKIIVAGGLGPDNVGEAIRTAAPWGVDASSRLESSPGRKDPEKVEAYVKAARNAAKLESPR